MFHFLSFDSNEILVVSHINVFLMCVLFSLCYFQVFSVTLIFSSLNMTCLDVTFLHLFCLGLPELLQSIRAFLSQIEGFPEISSNIYVFFCPNLSPWFLQAAVVAARSTGSKTHKHQSKAQTWPQEAPPAAGSLTCRARN